MVAATIRLRFDGRSSAYQGHSDVGHCRNPLTAIVPTYLFVYLNRSAAVGLLRNVGRRTVVARSNCSRMGVERRSNRN